MEEKEDGRSDGSVEAVVTVTPPSTAGVTVNQNSETTLPTLGVHHKDYSDDDTMLPATHLGINVAPTNATVLPQDSSSDESTIQKKGSFPATSFIIDPSKEDSTKHVPIQNITIPLSKLIEFMHNSFKCRSCNSFTLKQFTVERYGIATSLYFECMNTDCNNQTCCRGDLSNDLEEKWAAKPARKKFKDSKKDIVNAADFDLNNKLYLGTQQCGGGLMEGRVLSGILGLHSNPLKGRWKTIANEIGLKIIELGEDVIEENTAIEMELSPHDDSIDMKKISACGDCRWDKRSSGRRYDSISGCSVVIGCRSQMVLDISPMSNTCAKCASNKPHPPELCPKNADCSAKAMEAIGSAKIVQNLFKNYPAYIYEYVGDDDSSTKKVLRHSWKDEVDAGIRREEDFPRNKNGQKKPDNGLLPIDHPSIIWLADKGHRVRQLANKLFKLSKLKKDVSECTTMDAERLKRNLSYAIRTNCRSKSLPIMKAAVNQVVEHHFNNHEACGEWCSVKPLEGEV